MNNNPRIAAAAINTALFHIGSKLRRAPEKMNGRKVAIKGSAVSVVSSVDCEATNTEGISTCDETERKKARREREMAASQGGRLRANCTAAPQVAWRARASPRV